MSIVETVVDEDFVTSMKDYFSKPEGKTLYEACSSDIVLFSEYMLGITLYSWQVKWLKGIEAAVHGEHSTNEFSAVTSRQIGKSLSIAVLAIWCAVFNKYPGTTHNNTSIGVVSASDVQAKKLLYEIKKLLRSGDLHMKENYEIDQFFTSLLDENEPNNTTTITFSPWDGDNDYLLHGSKSGSVIKSYPPTSVVLGETFSVVVIDEAGKTERISDEFFEDYIYPTGNSTNAIRVYTSTPWVTSGFFYRMIDPDDLYPPRNLDKLLFTIDAIRLENPKYYDVVMKQVDQLNKEGKTDVVSRAYYCRFIKGQSNYFDPQKALRVFSKDYEMQSGSTELCDMGIDFGGQTTSKTVITISKLDEKSGDITRLFHRAYKVGDDLSLMDDVELLLGKFNVQRIVPDDCPAGWHLIAKMKEKGWNVHPMNFRSDKVKKYGAFRSSLNKGLVHSYDDEDLQVEMLAMEFGQGSRNSIIRAAPGYTDDLIDSFVMSCYFFVSEEGGFNFYNWDDVEAKEQW